MIDLTEAIIEIRKEQDGEHPQVTVFGNDINRITWHDDNPTNITNQQILDKQAELQANYDAKQYQRDRNERRGNNVYPPIEDQLDMIYHDQVNGTTTFKDAIKVVKDANPKGGS